MRGTTRRHIRQIDSAKRRRRRTLTIFACVAVLIAAGIGLALRQNGRAATRQERVLDCPVSGTVAHTHDGSCYDDNGNLVCALPEVERHVHDDSCYSEERALVCGMSEGEGAHWHDDSCYDEGGNLTCGLEETAGHVHDDSCYKVERTLVCGKDEVTEEHQHGPGCFQTVEVAAMPEQSFEHRFTDKDDELVLDVRVDAPEGALPEGSTMEAKWVDTAKKKNAEVQEVIEEAVAKKTDAEISQVHAVDITFLDAEGNEVEPAKKVTVTMASPQIADKDTSQLLVHVESDREAQERAERAGESTYQIEGEVINPLSTKQLDKRDLPDEKDQLVFDADQFSVYAIAYTVDFHYDVDGKTYDSSIPGGGFVSFRSLVEALGVAADDPTTSLDEVQELVDAVERIEFSDPSLVSVSRVEADTTVGGIKDDLGLECEYSADLTEAQIAEINARQVAAGDWALISLRPFDTEETLTVTMKNGDVWTVRVTDAQISANVLAANGERFRITVTYEDEAGIPDGATLVAEEIPEGSDQYDEYFEDTVSTWEDANKEGYVSFCRFFDIEIRKDGQKIEPQAPVEVDIKHEDGFAPSDEESLSVIHFADNGTEIIDDINKNENGTEVVYEQDSFSVIGTVSTVKDSGWPTTNGQYVLVLQDGEDYYALKQDGTLQKVRFFNNTVSFIGGGTTTTDYINDYLWYVVSSGNRGKISDEYTEYNATPDGQTFIDPYSTEMLSGMSRQLQITDGKVWSSGQLPGSSDYTRVSLSASGGQLSRVALTSNSASPMFFASASSFTANDNETDLFTQVEVESIIEKWKEQKTQTATYDKTAEVYDYENRVYQVDITASSADYEVSPSIALEFVVDASRSMFFPTSVTEVGTFTGGNAQGVRNWINNNGDRNQVYFVIQDKNGKATQYAIFYDTSSNQWRWVDASVYNPPDDVANGGTQNSRQSGLPLSEWKYGSLDDGKIYTTDITGTSSGSYGERKTWISRIEYLKQCVRVAAQVIYAVDDNAQIGLIGFNKNTTDYGTYGKDQQQELLNQLNGVSLDGGTNHQAGLQKAIDKYNKGTTYYAEHYAGRKHVVVLVTDGAPNASGVTWTTIGNTATNLKNLTDDFGHKTELYTMGLSLSNVGSNQTNLFNVSSGAGYTYAGEDAAQIINAVTKMVDGIFVQANLVADVTDVIDPAFYPVDSASGLPLAEDEWINLSGKKVSAGASDAAGQIKKDAATGNWYVEWKNQSIDWPTTNSSGAVVEPGWHGTVFVKAKEDFLGGNGISTNAAGSQLEATKFKVRGETMEHTMPTGDHTTEFETPYVNIDELDITKNDTEWSVYLGTNVDPLAAVKELWNNVKVREVVTQTGSDHRVSSGGALTYEYRSNKDDNRDEVNGREEFPITDLGIELTDADWADLIAGNSKIFDYNAYDHTKVGTIMVSLTQQVVTGEKNLSESPHDTAVTGNEVEKYTLTVSYRPMGANISNWHTGSFGTGVAGTRAGSIVRNNTHIINVHVKGLQITKVGLDDQILTGAKFALYRSVRDGETDNNLTIDGNQYYKVADLDTSATGIAVKDSLEQLKSGEQYYLVETQTPDGYNAIPPIPVTLQLTDVFTPKPGSTTQTTKPTSSMYDWVQNSQILINTAGVKRTDADNLEDLTHSGNANTNTETIYYRITNNPGVVLPAAGGPGTTAIYLIGMVLVAGAAGILMRKKRRVA